MNEIEELMMERIKTQTTVEVDLPHSPLSPTCDELCGQQNVPPVPFSHSVDAHADVFDEPDAKQPVVVQHTPGNPFARASQQPAAPGNPFLKPQQETSAAGVKGGNPFVQAEPSSPVSIPSPTRRTARVPLTNLSTSSLEVGESLAMKNFSLSLIVN
jgi:hypothetical protein